MCANVQLLRVSSVLKFAKMNDHCSDISGQHKGIPEMFKSFDFFDLTNEKATRLHDRKRERERKLPMTSCVSKAFSRFSKTLSGGLEYFDSQKLTESLINYPVNAQCLLLRTSPRNFIAF